MDLLDFSDCKLHFEAALPGEAERLLDLAASQYGEPGAEVALLHARRLAPENLSVLVGLYRHYIFRQRLEDALSVAERAMQIAARHLGLPENWRLLDESALAAAAFVSFGLLRFYLLALKASSIVLLRLGELAESRARLAKLAALDARDQLGAAKLLELVDAFKSPRGCGNAAQAPSKLNLALA